MFQILLVAALVGSPLASARPVSLFWDRLCARRLEKERPPPSPKASLMAILLRANAEVPQRLDFINLSAVARYLIDPIPSPHLLSPLTRAEFDRTKQAMNRAHAAFDIDYVARPTFWENLQVLRGRRKPIPWKSHLVSRDQLQKLMSFSFAAILLQLGELEYRLEGRFEERFAANNNHVEKFLDFSEARKRAFGERIDRFYGRTADAARRALLASWGARLQKVLWSTAIREHARIYRESTAEVYREHGSSFDQRQAAQFKIMAVFSKPLREALALEFGHDGDDRVFHELLDSVLISEADIEKRLNQGL